MTRFLLATGSVHATAAACDYLGDRLTGGDVVTAFAVAEPGGDRHPRDGADALNVATARLSDRATVETARVEGDVADGILEHAADGDVDEIVVGAPSGAPGAGTGLGRTIRAVVARASVPVVVVPPSRPN